MKQETRKQEIIRIAAKLFKEKGYSAVTMRDLAKAMGIKAASLYNHINSKQDILKTIIISLAEEFTEGMKLIQTSDENCIDKLKSIIELHVRISSQNIYGMASLNNDWMHLEEKLEYYQKLRIDYENDFRNILKEGIVSGEIVNVKPDVMMFSILTTLRSLYIWIPKKEDLNLEELSSTLSKILITGINK
ncbi:TetR/AcrR family transcriptional regulator [uncultured Winogradskyella sp.]|uniref:TetR/AcrR family transcriptional regulator n=1 Tax=uncultured Winogradskyella sp. TaxID=395353 RepID=UPI0026363186|nr:TetR/AcrR family transcriptional regulator [uncultured Winogradskyella sp.]